MHASKGGWGVMLRLMTPKTARSTVKAGRVNGEGVTENKLKTKTNQKKKRASYCISSYVKPFGNIKSVLWEYG